MTEYNYMPTKKREFCNQEIKSILLRIEARPVISHEP